MKSSIPSMILRSGSLLQLWAVELNNGILPIGHPRWVLGGQLLSLARLQTNLHVGLEGSQATKWCRPKTTQCGTEIYGVAPVPITSQLPVVEIAFKKHQVCFLQGCVQVGCIGCHVAELMGLRPERMVVIPPNILVEIALPLEPTLTHPLVIGCHGLPNGPLKVVSRDIRDEPWEAFAVKMNATCQTRGHQEIC